MQYRYIVEQIAFVCLCETTMKFSQGQWHHLIKQLRL